MKVEVKHPVVFHRDVAQALNKICGDVRENRKEKLLNIQILQPSDFDIVLVSQANATTEDDWKSLAQRITGRAGNRTHQLYADCNPDNSLHYSQNVNRFQGC